MTARLERNPEKRNGRLKWALAALLTACALALSALAAGASAEDVVQRGRTIEAFLGTNLVDVQGYPANRGITIEVVRNGVIVGRVSGTTDAEGFAEFNHVGGGQVSAGGDCFQPPATPDIMAGDTIRTTTEGDAAGVRDSAVARDLGIDFGSISVNTTNNTITVSGHARSRRDAEITRRDVLELRLNKGNPDNTWETGPGLDQDRPGRKDLRVDINRIRDARGNFTRVLRVSHDDAVDWRDNPGEVALEWSAPLADAPPAIFVADEGGGEPIVGCPPLADYAITDTSHKFVNQRNVTRDMVLGGVAFDADRVNVSVGGGPNHRAVLSRVGGQQTWEATIPARELKALPQGPFAAKATFVGPGAPTSPGRLRMVKDTRAPGKPTATPGAGTYTRSQSVTLDGPRGTKVHYTVNGDRPGRHSRVFRDQIRVTATQTIKAISVDKAGNKSDVAAFRYVIR